MSSPVQSLPATMPLAFSDFTVVTSLGRGRDNTVVALFEGRSALASCTFDDFPFPTYVGEIAGLDAAPLRGEFAGFDCRNNRLAAITLREDNFVESVAVARQRYGAARIGVFVVQAHPGCCRPRPRIGVFNPSPAGCHRILIIPARRIPTLWRSSFERCSVSLGRLSSYRRPARRRQRFSRLLPE